MNDYWKKRQKKKLFNILKNADITADYVAKIYQKASLYLNQKIQGIFDKYRAKNGLSIQEAKSLLNSLKQGHDYDELLQKLRSGVSSKERKELLKKLDAPAYAYRIKMLQEAQNDIDLLMNNIYNQEKEISTLSYIKSAYDGYYKDVFNIQKDVNIAYQFNKLNPNEVNAFIKSRWSGKNYSERIWNNTQALADSLKDEMMIGVLTGKTEKEMADTITEKFQVGAYQSRRLIRTEVAAVASFIDQEAFEDAGIEFEMFIAVHDGKTSKICQKHDRSVVEVGKGIVGQNIPPMHPNCRSVMIPYFEGITENMKKRQRNPITGEDEIINVNETYDQWLKRQQKDYGVDTVDTYMKKTANYSSDKKQYQRYKDVLSKEDMPDSLAKFQEIKYNDVEKWEDLKKLYKATNNGRILQEHLDYVWKGERGFIPTGAALTNIHIIAGAGSKEILRVSDWLVDLYGGYADEWSKKVAKVTSEKYIFDVHWYEHDKKQYRAKVKMRKDRI